MIELSRHIESLLLEHDCVIIPGLGGFITQYVPARHIEDEQMLLPPYRSVGFNQQLTLNDGLLVQSYMQAYDTNYPDTIKLIDDAVNQMKEELQEKGEYTLSGIGCISLGIGGQYKFTPCESGVLSPDFYGLDTFILPEKKNLENKIQELKKDKKNKTVQIKRSERNYTISISREIVNYAASIAAAIFFYFLWATPVTPSNPQDIQASSVIYNQLFATEASAIPKAAKQEVKNQATSLPTQPEEATVSQTEINVNSFQTGNVSVESQPKLQNDKYTIVLASAVPDKSAEEFATILKEQGFCEAYTYKRGHMNRVVYGNFTTETEAHEALRKLQEHEQFADAWVLKK